MEQSRRMQNNNPTTILVVFLAASLMAASTGISCAQEQSYPIPDTSGLTIEQKIQLIEKLQEEVNAVQATTASKGQPPPQQVSKQVVTGTKEAPRDQYAPGWVVTVFKANEEIETIPNESLGQFVFSDTTFSLDAHRASQAMQWYKGQAWYLYEAFFHAKEDGEYTFIAQITMPPMAGPKSSYHWNKNMFYVRCAYYLELEGNAVVKGTPFIASERSPVEDTMVGSAQLEEGIYKVRQWFACQGQRPSNPYVRGGLDADPTDEVKIYLKIKEPNSQMPRDLTVVDFVHKVVQ